MSGMQSKVKDSTNDSEGPSVTGYTFPQQQISRITRICIRQRFFTSIHFKFKRFVACPQNEFTALEEHISR